MPLYNQTQRQTAATAVMKDVKTPDALDEFVAQNELGTALEGFLTAEGTKIQGQKSAKAAAAVGNRTALTEVEKASKANPWEEFMFGKDATHTGAQQQVVQNRLRGEYNRQLSEVEQNANVAPKEYFEQMSKYKASVLEEYADDPSTAAIISNQIDGNISKLANVQAKEHYGWKQAEGKRLYEEQLNQTFDSFNLERQHTLTPEAKQEQMAEIKRVMLGGDKPQGMTDKAQRQSMLDVVMNSARNGNSGPLLAAQAIGLNKKLSAGEQVKWDAALRSYDTQFGRQIETIKSNAQMQIANALYPHQVDAAAQEEAQALQEMYQRSSGSPYAQKLIQGGELDVAKTAKKGRTMRQQLAKEMTKTKQAADKKKADLEVQAEEDAAGMEYFTTSEIGRQASIQAEYGFTKKEKEQYFDTYLMESSKVFMPDGEVPNITTFSQQLQKDPKLQQYVLQQMNKQETVSPTVVSVMETVKNGSVNLYDADGKVTPGGMNIVAMMETLGKSDKFVDMLGGKNANREWTLRANAIKAGQGQQAADQLVNAFRANLPKQDASGFSWKNVIGAAENRREWMRTKMKAMKLNPSEQAITDALYDYREDMIAFGDTKLADQTFFNRMNNNKVKANGQSLYGAEYLNQVTEYSLDDTINMMTKNNMMVGKLGVFPSSGEPFRSISDLPAGKIEVRDGVQGFFIVSPLSSNEAFVSVDEMRQVASAEKQKKEIDKIKKKRKKYEGLQRGVDIMAGYGITELDAMSILGEN